MVATTDDGTPANDLAIEGAGIVLAADPPSAAPVTLATMPTPAADATDTLFKGGGGFALDII
jgi:hypothetical protein